MKYFPVIVLILGANLAFAEVSPLSESEIEQRNVAAVFALTREAAIPTLIGECSLLLKGNGETLDVEVTLREWYDRNKEELETAATWLDRTLSDTGREIPERRSRASDELMKSVAAGILKTVRSFFKRQLPDQRTCEGALRTYAISQLDIKNLGNNQGFEKLKVYGATLKRIRNDPEFNVKTSLKIGYETAAIYNGGLSRLATLDAADAAGERGDGEARIAAFLSLVQRGDGSAAQTIGLMYLRGDLVQKNLESAYYWFYTAWSLADYDGLNAMGVMLRENQELSLAKAAFMLAAFASREKATRDRARLNAEGLESIIDPEGTRRAACFSLKSLDDELRHRIPKQVQLFPGKLIENSERKLGALVPDLSTNFDPASCK